MKIGEDLRFIVINKSADSLYSLIADGQHRSTFLGPEKWKSLIGSQGYLHRYCNKDGFNLEPEGAYWKNKACKARIGILANYNKGCVDVDSRIGFGTGGPRDDNNTCGIDAGVVHIKAMGYILVQLREKSAYGDQQHQHLRQHQQTHWQSRTFYRLYRI